MTGSTFSVALEKIMTPKMSLGLSQLIRVISVISQFTDYRFFYQQTKSAQDMEFERHGCLLGRESLMKAINYRKCRIPCFWSLTPIETRKYLCHVLK